jgi:3-methyladenine DNA glycosylase
LDRKFFDVDGITLAKRLLNQYLIREYDNKKIITKIVETEAYMGENDKAAHAYKNRKSVELLLFI